MLNLNLHSASNHVLPLFLSLRHLGKRQGNVTCISLKGYSRQKGFHTTAHILLEDKALFPDRLNTHRLKVRFPFYIRIRNLMIQRRILIFR